MRLRCSYGLVFQPRNKARKSIPSPYVMRPRKYCMARWLGFCVGWYFLICQQAFKVKPIEYLWRIKAVNPVHATNLKVLRFFHICV